MISTIFISALMALIGIPLLIMIIAMWKIQEWGLVIYFLIMLLSVLGGGFWLIGI